MIRPIAILAGQLIGIAWILEVVIGVPKLAGCMLGAGVVTVYFAAGGLKSSAIVRHLSRRPLAKASLTKSMLSTSLGA